MFIISILNQNVVFLLASIRPCVIFEDKMSMGKLAAKQKTQNGNKEIKSKKWGRCLNAPMLCHTWII
jgi:hypothetical protein